MKEPSAPIEFPDDIGPGARLRRAREAANRSIGEISAALHLDPKTVEALEADSFDRLPAPTFVRGYMRGYARELGLPPGPILEVYDHQGFKPPALTPDITETPQTHASDLIVRLVTYAVGAVLVLLVVLWWHSQEFEGFDIGDIGGDLIGWSSESTSEPSLPAPEAPCLSRHRRAAKEATNPRQRPASRPSRRRTPGSRVTPNRRCRHPPRARSPAASSSRPNRHRAPSPAPPGPRRIEQLPQRRSHCPPGPPRPNRHRVKMPVPPGPRRIRRLLQGRRHGPRPPQPAQVTSFVRMRPRRTVSAAWTPAGEPDNAVLPPRVHPPSRRRRPHNCLRMSWTTPRPHLPSPERRTPSSFSISHMNHGWRSTIATVPACSSASSSPAASSISPARRRSTS